MIPIEPLRRLASAVVVRAIRSREWEWFETPCCEFWVMAAGLDYEAVRSRIRADPMGVYWRVKQAVPQTRRK